MRKFPLWVSYPLSSSCNMSGLCLTLRRWISIGDCFLPPQAGYLVGQCIWSKAPSVPRKLRAKSYYHVVETPHLGHWTVINVCEGRSFFSTVYISPCLWKIQSRLQVVGWSWHAQDSFNWIVAPDVYFSIAFNPKVFTTAALEASDNLLLWLPSQTLDVTRGWQRFSQVFGKCIPRHPKDPAAKWMGWMSANDHDNSLK